MPSKSGTIILSSTGYRLPPIANFDGAFDVYQMPSADGQGYVVDVQAELLSHVATMVPATAAPRYLSDEIRGLNFQLTFKK